MCVSEVEQFESDLTGSSLHVSGHFKERVSTELPFASIVRLFHSICLFPDIKVARVQFGNLLSTSVIEL